MTKPKDFYANENKPRQKITEPKCPHCGGDSFTAPYTERAWEDYAADSKGKGLVPGESGSDLEDHETELENGRCDNYKCMAPLDLSGLEVK